MVIAGSHGTPESTAGFEISAGEAIALYVIQDISSFVSLGGARRDRERVFHARSTAQDVRLHVNLPPDVRQTVQGTRGAVRLQNPHGHPVDSAVVHELNGRFERNG
jgi:hypothetical protein